MMFKRVTIIGLGLIGGSLGMAIKKKRLASRVIGVSRKESTIRKAKAIGAVDSVTLDVKKGVKDSDLVILTTPVLKIMDIARRISKDLKKDAIVIDAGSTKSDIVKRIERSFPNAVKFVGSHPVAGSEHSGVSYARGDLFKGSYCILTKTNRTDPKALNKIKRFWNNLDMKAVVMSPKRHDKIISRLSHLPHAASVSLCNTCRKEDLGLTAGGFRDTTRIASGSPELWRDIFITNRKNIAKDIRLFKKELSKIETALKNNNSRAILRLLKKAKAVRDSLV